VKGYDKENGAGDTKAAGKIEVSPYNSLRFLLGIACSSKSESCITNSQSLCIGWHTEAVSSDSTNAIIVSVGAAWVKYRASNAAAHLSTYSEAFAANRKQNAAAKIVPVTQSMSIT
jgi:hypothetical protein